MVVEISFKITAFNKYSPDYSNSTIKPITTLKLSTAFGFQSIKDPVMLKTYRDFHTICMPTKPVPPITNTN